MKTILVPFDFSEYALAALLTAKKIALKAEAQLICVSVIPSEIDWDLLPEKARLAHSELLEELEEAHLRIPEYLKMVAPAKIQPLLLVKIGVPAEQILREVVKNKVDLVVLGAYGKGFADGKFIGSTLQKVLRNAACPVLAVKKALDGNAFRKIAFASVFDAAAKKAFSAFVPFIKLFASSVHLVYVNTPEHFVNSSDAERLMKSFSKSNEELTLHLHVVNDKNSVDGIHSFCVERGISLVALHSEDKKGKPSYQVGTTETLIFKSDRAVLSVKSPDYMHLGPT